MYLEAMAKIFPSPESFREQPSQVPLTWTCRDNPLQKIIDVDDLTEIFDGVIYQRDSVRMVTDGDSVNPARYCAPSGVNTFTGAVLPRSVSRMLNEKASLVINHLERYWTPLRTYLRRLTYEVGSNIESVGFLTPPGSTGFRPHEDPVDVLVYQVSGRKHWKVYEPLVENPFLDEVIEDEKLAEYVAEREPFLEVTLGPGDCLWVPRGWVHAGTSDDAACSWHVSLVFGTSTFRWLAEEIIGTLTKQDEVPYFRPSLPWGAAIDRDLMHTTVLSALNRMRDGLLDLNVGQVVKNAQTKLRAEMPGPRYPVAPAEIGPETYLELIPESVMSFSHQHDGSLRLNLPHATVTLTNKLVDFFLPIFTGKELDRGWIPTDLVPRVTLSSSIKVARRMHQLGIAQVGK
ncbi:cupin domain-containing protein [Streptomyces sp. NPDC013172]|uniref:JmjC domain-containing protein n=1 Tax=Streptomyces sp. NPDC013172 TaxID=3155009 RepID=UPI0033FD684B